MASVRSSITSLYARDIDFMRRSRFSSDCWHWASISIVLALDLAVIVLDLVLTSMLCSSAKRSRILSSSFRVSVSWCIMSVFFWRKTLSARTEKISRMLPRLNAKARGLEGLFVAYVLSLWSRLSCFMNFCDADLSVWIWEMSRWSLNGPDCWGVGVAMF